VCKRSTKKKPKSSALGRVQKGNKKKTTTSRKAVEKQGGVLGNWEWGNSGYPRVKKNIWRRGGVGKKGHIK